MDDIIADRSGQRLADWLSETFGFDAERVPMIYPAPSAVLTVAMLDRELLVERAGSTWRAIDYPICDTPRSERNGREITWKRDPTTLDALAPMIHAWLADRAASRSAYLRREIQRLNEELGRVDSFISDLGVSA